MHSFLISSPPEGALWIPLAREGSKKRFWVRKGKRGVLDRCMVAKERRDRSFVAQGGGVEDDDDENRSSIKKESAKKKAKPEDAI